MDETFADFVSDQLTDLPVEAKKMFGGHGLYCEGVFFGIVHKGRLYFKTNEHTKAAYERRGMKPFQPDKSQTLKNYYEVPIEIIEDHEELTAWALGSIEQAV